MEAMGIIFSNIYDSKMGNLTWERTSGSIPFGGRYRQIDFVLSNMSNSGIRNIGIITKYNYQSLMDHLANCEDWDLHLGENVRFLPPYATGHTGAYRGKLEALQTALPVLERSDAEYVILSDTTVLCAIDFAEVVDAHVASGCDLTVVAKAGRADGRRTQTLALKVDESGKVVDLAVDYCAPKDYLSGMSMFVIERKKLLNVIQELVPHGKCYFERDFVLPQYNEGKLSVNVYSFQNIALFNESLQEFYKNNLKLLDQDVRHSLFRTNLPIYTKVRDSVPTLFGEHGQASDCLVADIRRTGRNQTVFNDLVKDDVTEELVVAVNAVLFFHDTAISCQNLRVRLRHFLGKFVILGRKLRRTGILVRLKHDFLKHVVRHDLTASGEELDVKLCLRHERSSLCAVYQPAVDFIDILALRRADIIPH